MKTSISVAAAMVLAIGAAPAIAQMQTSPMPSSQTGNGQMGTSPMATPQTSPTQTPPEQMGNGAMGNSGMSNGMSQGSAPAMSASDTRKMKSCQKMSHDMMMKSKSCMALMQAHPDMMSNDAMPKSQ